MSAEAAEEPSAPDKWSVQQTIGHLCDSAMNNQQRVVRLQLAPTLELAGYEQDGWVRVQRYEMLPWAEVVGLWVALNRHLAHTVRYADRAALSHVWRFEGADVTLAFVIEDYVAHLEHHLRALNCLVDADK